ncbi:hypothetical protein HELRODRAFT_161920 [Helobdella robusta]|uniref:Uncharacterized protein n=1 Tax=Helobdella robusta TaxID=6412 RepID=T1ES16_HELRO|nr:hypothetical protein HELRODRAFT_161920 [Helobdella robusta]ESO02631.1 hypothetical protein HELRODRAFT_161920 [Helobdella robusta]
MSGSINTDRDYRGCVYIPRADGHHSHGENGQFSVVELPTFKVNANQKHSKVEVFVEDPTGQTIKPYVKVVGDLYTSTFLPKMTGDYLVSMCVDGENIEGSPFYVKVFDPKLIRVLGLRGGIVSQLNGFSVNTDGIGEGPMAITITHLGSNRIVPARIMQDPGRKSLFHVEWMPEEAGFYRVNVQFARVDADGSPYTIEVINPSLSTISGLTSGQLISAGQLNKFIIRVPSKMVVMNEMRVDVTDPIGVRVPARLIDNNDGTVAVEFLPIIIGSHVITASYFNMAISGSPFKVTSFDPAKVKIINWKPLTFQRRAQVTLTLEFLEARPPTRSMRESMESIGSPLPPNNRELLNLDSRGPWTCVVASAPTAAAFGNGVQPSPSLLINTPTFFEVKVQGSNEDAHVDVVVKGCYSIEIKLDGVPISGSPFTSRVYSPGSVILGEVKRGFVGREVEFSVDASQAGDGSVEAVVDGGVYSVTFMPKEAKVYNATVKFNGETVKGSPVSVNVLDLSKVTLVGGSGDLKVAVNKVCTLKLNTAGSGNGQFTAIVRAPSGAEITPLIREVNKKFLEIEYTPKEIGVYCVEVELEGMALAVNPIQFSTYNSSKIKGDLKFSVLGPNGGLLNNSVEQINSSNYSVVFTPLIQGQHQFTMSFNEEPVIATGQTLRSFACNKMATFFITSPHVIRATDCDVKITDPSLKNVSARLSDMNDGTVRCDFTGAAPGDYKIDVKCWGHSIPDSPFLSKASDVTKVTVTPILSALVGLNSSFNINVKDAGEGTLEISIQNPNGQQIPNSVAPLGPGQFVVTFMPAIQGTHHANVTFNEEPVKGSPFSIQVNDPTKCQVKGPKNLDVRSRISEQGPGVFKVEYTPLVPGDYVIDVEIFGKEVPNGPFTAKCWDHTKVKCTKIASGRVGVQTSFNLDASGAGEGDMEIVISGPSRQNIANHVTPLGPGLFVVTFTPEEGGVHKVSVTFNQENVTGSPFIFNVIDLGRASARGDGLGAVKVNTNASFLITAPGAMEKDLELLIMEMKLNISAWPYLGCPYYPKVWDSSKVLVTNVKNGRVGNVNVFNLDVTDAGEGTLEIGVTSPSGQNIHNNVMPSGAGKFEVSCVPLEPGMYKISVTFNRENVVGSPYSFLATDMNKVLARGDGLGGGRCGVATSFVVTAPAAQQKDVDIIVPTTFHFRAPAASGRDVHVKVTGPDYKDIVPRVIENHDQYTVEFIPLKIGDHVIEVTYFGEMISCCPFVCKAYNASLVQLTPAGNGAVNKASHFTVNTGQAGVGALDVVVTADGLAVPCVVKSMSSCLYDVSFTPQVCHSHDVCVKFNGEEVPGSPLHVLVIDGSKATAAGHGLELAKVNAVASFDVITNNPPNINAKLEAHITNAKGQFLPCKVTSTGPTSYHVEYVPKDAGCHKIALTYAGSFIQGSPYNVDAFDSNAIKISCCSYGVVGKQYCFEVDTTKCGCLTGHLDVEVKGHLTKPITQVTSSRGVYTVNFVASENVSHNVAVTYLGENCSPFSVKFIDPKNMHVNWDSVCHMPVNRAVTFDLVLGEVNMTSLINVPGNDLMSAICRVRDPNGRELATRIDRQTECFRIEFQPTMIGPHTIDLKFGGTTIVGSPHICNVYNAAKVVITDANIDNQLGRESCFTVDSSRAGDGYVEVKVICGEAEVITRAAQIGDRIVKYSFMPVQPKPHVATVKFCSEPVQGSPLTFQVINPANKMTLSRTTPDKIGPLGQPITALLLSDGFMLNLADIKAEARGASSELLVTTLTSELDGTNKITFTPNCTGPAKLDVSYCGKAVSGSPLIYDIFDACKVVAEIQNSGVVDQPVSFDVVLSKAGSAPLDIKITNGRNVSLPMTNQIVSYGQRVTYIPKEAGLHVISIQYGCVDVPGSPFHQQIIDSFMPTAHGEGLENAIENSPATFTLDTRGHYGNLKVDVQGSPFQVHVTSPKKVQVVGGWESILDHHHHHMPLVVNEKKMFELDCSKAGPGNLRVNVTGPDGVMPTEVHERADRRYHVGFTPRVEGNYTMKMYYNEQPLERFPVLGTAVRLLINQKAPPPCPVHYHHHQSHSHVHEQEHQIKLAAVAHGQGLTSAKMLEEAEFFVVVPDEKANSPFKVKVEPLVEVPERPIIAMGYGIAMAEVNREAEFLLDGVDSDEQPKVIVSGPVGEIPVYLTRFSPERYRCCYTPNRPGSYVLTVTHKNKHITGSPFNVLVSGRDGVRNLPPTAKNLQCGANGLAYNFNGVPYNVKYSNEICNPNPFLVVAMGPGLSRAVKNQPAEFIVDTSASGPGDVTIQLTGPKEDVPVKIYQSADNIYQCHVIPDQKALNVKDVVVVGRGLCEGLVDEPAEFIIDATQAGPGKPEVKITEHKNEIPCKISQVVTGIYKCTYVPPKEGEYHVFVLYGEVLVPGAPYEVMVKNPPKEKPDKFMVVTGPGMSLAVVGQRAEFLLDGFEYDNLNMRLNCQNGMDLPLQLFKIEPNKYICAYTPTVPVNVVEEMNLLPFPRPFNLKVKYENSDDDDDDDEEEEDKDGGFLGRFFNGGKKTKRMKKKKVVDARIVTTNLDPLQHFADYSIHHKHCDQPVVVIGPGKTEAVVNKMAEFIIDGAAGEPTIHLTGVEGDIEVQCSKLTSCRYHCSYIPQKEGVYLLNIATGGLNVPGCPFKVQVTNGSEPSLIVVAPECPDGKNMIAVGPGLGTVYEKKTAEFIIDGTDCEGVYLMNIQIKGVNIPGSPFKVTVLPEDVPKPPSCAAVAVGEGLIFGSKNKRAEFVIDGVVAGEPMILCQGPAGTYIIHISVGGTPVCGSPFNVTVTDEDLEGPCYPEKVLVIGPGVSFAVPGVTSEFIIDASAAGKGTHTLSVAFNGKHIPGSPFKFECMGQNVAVAGIGDASKVVAIGPGLSGAQVNGLAEFLIDGCQDFTPMVQMYGSAMDVPVQCVKIADGRFKCSYIPQASGVHILIISVCGSQIPGSPFKVNVAENGPEVLLLQKPFATGQGLSVAQVGQRAEFMMEGVFNWVYLMTVSCGDCQIIGSPFKVTVGCDEPPLQPCPVKTAVAIGPGLSDANVGKTAEFLIDGACDSPEIKMIGLTGDLAVQSSIIGEDRYKCSYTPTAPGLYLLSISCCGFQLPGSPFKVVVPPTVEEFHPSRTCVAIGPGLSQGCLDKISEFIIDGAGAAENLQVQMVGRSGNEVLIRSLNMGNGRYLCSYMPHIPGEYQLSVKSNNNHISGSPFRVLVTSEQDNFPARCPDPVFPPRNPPVPPPSVVIVSPETKEILNPEILRPVCAIALGPGLTNATLHQVAEFLIDGCFDDEPQVLLAGVADNIPVHAMKIGEGRFKCAYTPEKPGVYLLSIACNGSQVIGSPFKIVVEDVKPPEVERKTIVVSGLGTSCGSTSKSTKEGVYLLSISYQGLQVPGSPFKVLVGSDDGRPCFDSDGKSCPDACKPVAIGPGLTCAEMNSVAEFMLDGAGPTEPQIVMIGVNGEVPVKYVKLAEGRYKCAYVPQAPGVYLLSITCHGNQIPGSPFKVTVHGAPVFIERPQPIPIGVVQQPPLILQQPQHPQLILQQQQPQVIVRQQPVAMGQGLYLGQANQMTEFVIDSCPDVPEIQMHGCDCEVFVRCFRVDDCRYKCIYMLSLSIKGVQIPGSPFKVVIQPDSKNPNIHQLPPLIVPAQIVNTPIVVPMHAGKVFAKPPKTDHGDSDDEDNESIAMKPTTFSSAVASGPGLMGAQLNDLAEFVVDGSRDEPIAHMHGVDEEVAVRFHEVCDGRWKGSYLVSKPGTYSLTLITNGLQVKGCPFKISVHPPVKATNADIYYKKKKQTIAKTVQRTTPESVATTYTEFMSIVDEPEDSAPLPPRERIKPCIAQNAIALGGGLTQAYCGKAAEFMVDCSNAGHGFLKAQLVGITNAVDVHSTDIGEKRYVCSYIPKVQGAYLLNVTWSDQPIPGSPFKVAVMSSVDPSKVTFSGDVFTNGGIVGQPINVMVDAKNAGKDELKATCKGPNKFTQCKVEEVAEGLFNVSFTPEEPGPHLLHFLYAGVMIPNCPATIRIAGPIDPSKVVVTGKGVQDGVLATFDNSFTVETKGAGPGQLTVRMRGRKDTFRIEMRRDPMNNRTIHCRYNPTEVGLYILDIKWSGQHVPGSPFKIHLFDSMMELNQFKRTGAIEGFAANRISELGKNDSIRSNGFDNEFD